MSEEKKYEINVNRPEPDSADIKKYENFNSVISKHRDMTKRPVYKRKRTYFAIFLILILIYIIYLSEKEKKAEEKGLPQTEQTPK
ncbi:MAG: hypothetical protein KDD41_05220 [Flavobacteriales bacterium]|nr:hypothetical protein [Flavobacteriales bacterium]